MNGENCNWNSILVTKDLMHPAGRNREHSCLENFHGDDLYPHNINKHSCTHQSLPEHQASKMHVYDTNRNIKSSQHICIPHVSSNSVRETFNNGLNPSEVDWGDPRGEPTNHTSSGHMLNKVNWGGKLKLNYTSC